jgi:UDP-galactopyranose mutase
LLELADREFNLLSREIDNYSKTVQRHTEKGELEIPINTTSLRQYLRLKFKEPIKEGLIAPHFNGYDQAIIDELKSFGVLTLKDLDVLFKDDFVKKYSKNVGESDENFLGLLRNVMIITDYNKYFEKSYSGNWGGFHEESDAIFEAFKIDVTILEEKIKEKIKKLK